MIRDGVLQNAWPYQTDPPAAIPVAGCGDQVYLLNRSANGNFLARYPYRDGVLQLDGATTITHSGEVSPWPGTDTFPVSDLRLEHIWTVRAGADCSLWFFSTQNTGGESAVLARIDTDGMVRSVAPFDKGTARITALDVGRGAEVWIAGHPDGGEPGIYVLDREGRVELVVDNADLCSCPANGCHSDFGIGDPVPYHCTLRSIATDLVTGDAYVGVTIFGGNTYPDIPGIHPLAVGRHDWIARVQRDGYFERYLGDDTLAAKVASVRTDLQYGPATPGPGGYVLWPSSQQWPNHSGDFRFTSFISPQAAPDGFVYFIDTGSSAGDDTIRRFRARGRTVAEELAIDGEVHSFDDHGRHIASRDPVSGATLKQFAYDPSGALVSIADGDGNTATIERDTDGELTAIVAPDGQRTELTTDTLGRLVMVTGPDGSEHEMVYDGDTSRLTAYTEPGGATSTFTYDDGGKLIRDQGQTGGFIELSSLDTARGVEVAVTDAEGVSRSIRRERTNDGVLSITSTGADGSVSRRVREHDQDTTTSPDGTKLVRVRVSDPNTGELYPTEITQVLPSGLTRNVQSMRTLEFATGIIGELDLADYAIKIGTREVTTVNGTRATVRQQSDHFRTITNTSPEGRVSTLAYDEHGRVTTIQAPGVAPMHAAYDTRGRLTSITIESETDSRVTTFSYDEATGYTNAILGPIEGSSTQFETDIMGRVTQQTLADGSNVGFGYDVSGNLTSLAPPSRPEHAFGYDVIGELRSYTAPAATNGSAPSVTQTAYRLNRQPLSTTLADDRVITLTYRPDGKVDTLVAPHGAYQHGYEASSGRLSSITTPEGHALTWTFDGPLPTSETWSGAGGVHGTVTYGYNNFFEVASVAVSGGPTTLYTHDDDGLLMSVGALAFARDAASGQLTGTTLSATTTSQSYTAFGEIAAFDAAASGSSVFGYQIGERDKLGRIVQRDETVQGVTTHYEYAYDLAGRLTDVWTDSVLSAHYTFDANGNRLSKVTPTATEIGTYDEQDRVQTYGGFTYVFDEAGVLTSKIEVATSAITAFDYDVLGNLRSVSLPDGRLIEYEIDARHRRVGKKIDGVVDHRLIYLNQLEPVAMLDGNNNVVATFVYGSKPHVPDFMVRSGVTYRYVTDHLGSVRLVVNASTGAVVQRIDYDEFGVVTLDTNPGFQPFGFVGGVYDLDTGLVRFGARDYDAVTGRWTARDPSLFNGGMNLYGYSKNDPINYLDVTGRFPFMSEWEVMDAINRFLNRAGVPFDMPGGPGRGDHGNRNQHNRCPSHPPNICGGSTEDDFTFDNTPIVGGKFRGAGGSECAYDSDGNLLDDPNQTFNFEPDPWDPGHWWDDFGAHFWYGGSSGYYGGQTGVY